MKKSTTEEFIRKANLIHHEKYNYTKVNYINRVTPVVIICKKHGEFFQKPADHLSGCGCPKCANERQNTPETHKQRFINLAKQIHDNKYDYSKVNYTSSLVKVSVTCPIHGDFLITPAHHLQGKGCRKCGYIQNGQKAKLTTSQFIEKCKLIHQNTYDYSKVDYKDNFTKVCIICPKHGEFWQSPNNHLGGHGCPHCKLKSQHILYEKLKNSFANDLILFEVSKNEVNWLNKMRLDIYFPKYNIAIEYDGIQHYRVSEFFGGEEAFQKRQTADKEKDNLCLNNHCILFRVKYNYTESDYTSLVNKINKIIQNEF